MKCKLIFVVVVIALWVLPNATSKQDKGKADRKRIENAVRGRVARRHADQALEKAIDIEVGAITDQVIDDISDEGGEPDMANESQTQPANAETGPKPQLNDIPVNMYIKELITSDDGPIPEASEYYTESDVFKTEWVADGVLLALDSKGNVFRSTDHGKTWVNLSRQSKKEKGDGIVSITEMSVNTVDKSIIVLIGKGSNSFISQNAGETFTSIGSRTLTGVKFHPYEKSWLLALSLSPSCSTSSSTGACYQELLYSHDFGDTWTSIATYVEVADWQRFSDSDVSSKDTIFACIHRTQSGRQEFSSLKAKVDLYLSNDYFASTPNKILVNGHNFLQASNDAMYVSVPIIGSDKNKINLYVKSQVANGVPMFVKANLPTLGQRGFTFVDSSEGMVFLQVNHEDNSDPSGTIFISDSSGMQFSLSLPNNRRGPDGAVDFEHILGIEGVYMANYIHEEDSSGAVVNRWQDNLGSTDKNNKLHSVRTVITFDKGGKWNYLQPPQFDVLGEEIQCWGSDDCLLHFHGINDEYGPLYSSSSAVGLILATGTIGRHLNDRSAGAATYLSRDAGLNWEQIAKGSHKYAVANQGSLIVMAQDSAPTRHILYSTNQGLQWHQLPVSKTPFQVDHISVDPSGSLESIILYGMKNNRGIIVHVDFSTLNQPLCQATDFEDWIPNDGSGDSSCLMGHRIKYSRRKRNAQCFVGAYEQSTFLGNCPCTDRDFECDVGFGRMSGSEECLPVDTSVEAAKDFCSSEGIHRITKGYRRIPRNTCVGGERWEPSLIPCSRFTQGIAHGILLLLFGVAVLMVVVALMTKHSLIESFMDKVRTKLKLSQDFFRKKTAKYDCLDDAAEFEDFGEESANASTKVYMDDCNEEYFDYGKPIPPMPGLIQSSNAPIPTLVGPKTSSEQQA